MWGKQDFALPWFAGFEALSASSWSMSSTNMSHCVGSACCCLLLATASFFPPANFPRHAPQFHWWPLLRDPIRPRPPTAQPGTAAPWTALMGPHHGMVSSKTHTTHDPPDYGNNLMLPPNGLQQQRKPWMQKACNCPLLVEIFTEKPDTWGRFGLWESLWRIHRALEHRT